MAFSEEPPPEGDLHVLFTSEASIAWDATLHPFADEFPTGANWIDFVTSADPAGEVKQLAQQWTREDERNPALQRAIPIPFVRGEVIKSTDRDLALAAAAGVAVTVDPLHQQVAAQRFNDPDAWKFHRYAVPLLFPWVGDLPWEEIADLRRDKQMARFRVELQEVEEEAMADAAAETSGQRQSMPTGGISPATPRRCPAWEVLHIGLSPGS